MFRIKILLSAFLLISFVSCSLIYVEASATEKVNDLEVLYLLPKGEPPQIHEHVLFAADSLGLKCNSGWIEKLPDKTTLERIDGVIIAPEVLLVEPKSVRLFLTRLPNDTPVLFPGLRRVHQEPLRLFGHSVTIEADVDSGLNPSEITVHSMPLTKYFGGLHLPYWDNSGFHLNFPNSQTIIGFQDSSDSALFLVHPTKTGRDFFFLADTILLLEVPSSPYDNKRHSQSSALLDILYSHWCRSGMAWERALCKSDY